MQTNNIVKIALVAVLSSVLFSCALPKKIGQEKGVEYTITVRNLLSDEAIASPLVVSVPDESKIWTDGYVTPEAHVQFTTGNPRKLAAVLGGDQEIMNNIPPKGKVTITFKTEAEYVQILGMVHPNKTPDNYISAKVTLTGVKKIFSANRFDIGDDEGRKKVEKVTDFVATIAVSVNKEATK